MKKFIEVYTLIVIIFVYLIIMLDFQFTNVDLVIMTKFFSDILKIVLSIFGFVLTFNNLRTKINNKVNFLAFSSLCISLFSMMQLRYYFIYRNSLLYITSYDSCSLVMESFQLVSLFISIYFISEHSHLTKLFIVTGIWIMVGIYFSEIELQLSIKLCNTNSIFIFKGVVYGFCLLMGAFFLWLSDKKIKRESLVEQRMIYGLFGVKFLVYLLAISNLYIMNLWIRAFIYFLQVTYIILIVAYVDEVTLAVTWKKIDSGVVVKNQQVSKGYVEQKTLVLAAREIQKDIKHIDHEILGLEMRMMAKNNEKDMKYIEKIKNNCHRLIKLSDNILDLNQYEAGNKCPHFERIDLAALLGEIVESLETYIMQRGIHVQYISSAPKIMVDIDRDAIERIFLNLLSNAIKYNKEAGQIKVTLAERRKRVYLCVQDTGIGIPHESLDLIFEKFQRVDTDLVYEQEGSGLGLSIVKSLVDMHHGEIKIVSREEKGTLISIGLPISQDEKTLFNEKNKVEGERLNHKIQVEFSDLEGY